MSKPESKSAHSDAARVKVGAEILIDQDFSAITGRNIGLITNQTGRAYGRHIADTLHAAPNVDLAAILGPEHGFRGRVEAGEKVRDGVDPKTGVRVLSLYGKTRKPTPAMLRGLDMLVFDIQDISARFYTYISTMGLAMQAAAEAHIPFVVLDRPNPLGGNYVAGFTLEPRYKSFVGQYPIPIVHGMTNGELAHMIQGERWLPGVEKLDLRVMLAERWPRTVRWPATGRKWIATSPNIPTYNSALVYPGIGIVGETGLVNEGRGTPEPFTQFGSPWLDATRLARSLNERSLPGIRFGGLRYRTRSIPGVAANPLFVGREINGVRLVVREVDRVQPLEIGMHVLALLIEQARARGIKKLFAKPGWFHYIAGTKQMHRMLTAGVNGGAIARAWSRDVESFLRAREKYLLYT